jgi:putative hemolysin
MAQQINIEALLKERLPKHYKLIPKFVISYLKRILCQEKINKFLLKHDGLSSVEFSQAVVDEFRVDLTISGLENIPKKGGCIAICNHPLGGLDAMALVPQLHKIRPDYKYIVNDILLNINSLKDIFIGVNKTGSSSRKSLEGVEKLFASDRLIVLFPSGMVSRKINGKVQDLKWHRTFFNKALKYDHPVVPIHISGRLSSFFYGLSKLRMFLGVKVNIEMMYLANELFKQSGQKVHFTIGKPIVVKELPQDLSVEERVGLIRNDLYKLAEKT